MGYVAEILNYFAANPSLLVAGLLLYLFIFILTLLFSSPKPGPNPFKKDGSRPPKPLITDQTARDKVLKQGFQAKLIPQDLDAIVIGSGIGGLTTAVLLSKAGKKVLVLEQHDQAGGCCHTFIEKGFEFDIGIHYIGQMNKNILPGLLVDQMTAGQLQWINLIEEFDSIAIGEPGKQRFYKFRAGGPTGFKQALLEKFPEEEEALDKFMALLKAVRRSVDGLVTVKALPKWIVQLMIGTGIIHIFTSYFKYARRTLKEVLDELTDNADLKAVLSYSFGDYGTEPGRGSFALHAQLINHYLYGGYYPRGGASEIAYHMIPLIEQSGGKVLVRANVSQILVNESGKATGVRVDRTSGPVDVFAPLVISDAGVVNTFSRLLTPEVARKSSISQLIGTKVDSGFSYTSLFVGLKGTTEELGLKPEHLWVFTGNDLTSLTEEISAKSVNEAASSDIPFCFITFPSAKDPTFQERYPGKSVCTVITIGNWEWFAQWENERVKKRGEDYESTKMAFGRKMWEHVLNAYPHLADKVEYFDVGTPLSNKYYIGSPKGEIYGLDHTAKRFGNPEVMMHLRPETGIPGLLLTGQDVFCCGFTGAMFGGLFAASTALNRNLYQDLVNLKKSLAKSK